MSNKKKFKKNNILVPFGLLFYTQVSFFSYLFHFHFNFFSRDSGLHVVKKQYNKNVSYVILYKQNKNKMFNSKFF